MATWENTSIFLRSITETIKGDSTLNLANYDEGIFLKIQKYLHMGVLYRQKITKELIKILLQK